MEKVEYSCVNHVAFATADMDRTIRFWRDLLQMPVVAAYGRPGNRQYFFSVPPASFITFFEWPEVEALPRKHHGAPVKGPFLFDHISIGVRRRADLYRLQDMLEAAEFSVSDAIDHGFIHSIYTYDPNGIPLEFSWRVEGEDVLSSPVVIDPSPVKTLQEGFQPVPGKWPRVTHTTPPGEWILIPGEGSRPEPKGTPADRRNRPDFGGRDAI